MTLGEFKKLVKGLPDDAEICWRSGGVDYVYPGEVEVDPKGAAWISPPLEGKRLIVVS